MQKRQIIGIATGLYLFIQVLLLPTPPGLADTAKNVAAVALLMASWWVTEAIPISATALIPLVLYPFLGILDAKTTALNYGHHYVMMLYGGFFIAKAIETHHLHRRMATSVIRLFSTSRVNILLGFMVTTAFLSMWITNVTVVLMMLPIAKSIINQNRSTDPGSTDAKFGTALMLAIAYSASIGGTGTLIGSPPNLVFAGIVAQLYPDAPQVTFVQWLLLGLPLVMIFIPIVWFYMVRYYRIKGGLNVGDILSDTKAERMTSAQKRVLIIFVLTALGWMFRKSIDVGSLTIPGWASLLGVDTFVNDSTVAFVGALLLFTLPAGKKQKQLLDWKTATTIPWGVGVLVGGGFAIAQGFAHTGLAEWIGGQLTFVAVLPLFFIVLFVIFFMTFLTEINSNTATANIFVPILGTMAVAGSAHPYLLMLPGAIACSFAFMLPSGTGTNAAIFGSGELTIPDMASCGFFLNLISIVLLTIIFYLVAVPMLGLADGLPSWAIF